ncbi:MAG: HAD family phosphatase [Selenomonadaceae bacterium]|nr:HAD family phosphatase [Selenomonadaceae bacterium]
MKNITDYKNIVFDMGGVLVDYTADNATRHFTDDEQIIREIHNVMFYSQEWLALDMGSMTDEKAISRILPRLSSDKVREIAKVTFEHWHEYNNVAREGVAEIIEAIKARGQRVYILSNVSRRLTNTYKEVVPAPELYDGAFFSGEVLALKPQPIIYQFFFERFNLKPEDCFFIDDLQENVDASIKCGMNGYCFKSGNNEDLKKVLGIA